MCSADFPDDAISLRSHRIPTDKTLVPLKLFSCFLAINNFFKTLIYPQAPWKHGHSVQYPLEGYKGVLNRVPVKRALKRIQPCRIRQIYLFYRVSWPYNEHISRVTALDIQQSQPNRSGNWTPVINRKKWPSSDIIDRETTLLANYHLSYIL